MGTERFPSKIYPKELNNFSYLACAADFTFQAYKYSKVLYLLSYFYILHLLP